MKSFVHAVLILLMGAGLGIVYSIPSMAQQNDCTKEAKVVPQETEDEGAQVIDCLKPDGESGGTQLCPEFMWITPRHWKNCDEAGGTQSSDCRCCKLKTYVRKKWNVKCVATVDAAGNVTGLHCVKSTVTLDTEDFTGGENHDCPDVGGNCPECP